jgi:hypothetical protein
MYTYFMREYEGQVVRSQHYSSRAQRSSYAAEQEQNIGSCAAYELPNAQEKKPQKCSCDSCR